MVVLFFLVQMMSVVCGIDAHKILNYRTFLIAFLMIVVGMVLLKHAIVCLPGAVSVIDHVDQHV
jgi:hypothetical protein